MSEKEHSILYVIGPKDETIFGLRSRKEWYDYEDHTENGEVTYSKMKYDFFEDISSEPKYYVKSSPYSKTLHPVLK